MLCLLIQYCTTRVVDVSFNLFLLLQFNQMTNCTVIPSRQYINIVAALFSMCFSWHWFCMNRETVMTWGHMEGAEQKHLCVAIKWMSFLINMYLYLTNNDCVKNVHAWQIKTYVTRLSQQELAEYEKVSEHVKVTQRGTVIRTLPRYAQHASRQYVRMSGRLKLSWSCDLKKKKKYFHL